MTTSAYDPHFAETCYIVGRGPSLLHLTAAHFADDGPVIALNDAIWPVQRLGLSNKLYAMMKDGCEGPHECDICEGVRGPIRYPDRDVTVLLHEHESRDCLPEHPDRRIFDAVHQLGFGNTACSAPCAIRLAKSWGVARIVLLCHDSLDGEYRTALNDGSLSEPDPGNYVAIAAWVRREIEDFPHKIVTP